MSVRSFGRHGGEEVFEITLAAGGVEAKILTFGAVVRDLRVPGRERPQRVVLGLNGIEDYAAHSPYFGAIVGRHANRIANGRFTLDGRESQLSVNEPTGHHLHGGADGFGTRNWRIAAAGADAVTLVLVSEDGDMGYPGRVVAQCAYSLAEPATLRVDLVATTDEATPVNLTTHGYYNLDGGDDICSHHLMIAADFITPTDEALIPTGAMAPVAGTDYDFRALRPIGASQLLRCHVNYDVNFVLRENGRNRGGGLFGRELSHAATLLSRRSGVAMELWTTEPGLQLYDGHLIDIPVAGLDGRPYGRNAGLCLEPQRFPDGPNHPAFPPCILRPGEVSRQASELRFSVG